jgi:hypothetical protein
MHSVRFQSAVFAPSGHGSASPAPIFYAGADRLLRVQALLSALLAGLGVSTCSAAPMICATSVAAGMQACQMHFHSRFEHAHSGREFEELHAHFTKGGSRELAARKTHATEPFEHLIGEAAAQEPHGVAFFACAAQAVAH